MAARPPTFSVVIPFHDDLGLLIRAVTSVRAQSAAAHEIVVVCNGPAFGRAQDVAERLGGSNLFVLAIPQANANAARNRGLDAATGDWCAFLDADDAFLPSKLAALAQAARGGTQLLFSRGRRVTASGRSWIFPAQPFEGDDLPAYFFSRGNFISTSAIAVETKAGRALRFDETVGKYQDLDFLIRAQATGLRIGFVAEPLYVYDDTSGANRLSRGRAFDRDEAWAAAYPHFDGRARAAFLARAVAQHQLPRHPLKNALRLVDGAIRGGIPPVHLCALAARGLTPRPLYERLLAAFHKGRRHG